ncbi:MAG: ABC transporter substrate-binding protein [Acidobacteria bacterium]|nr:ABC transporter substrate-binding protein [Acidobacteriota bacterium]
MISRVWFQKFLQAVSVVAMVLALGQNARAQTTPVVIRAGHFPNITHSQAVIGHANGWFDKALAPNAKVSWKLFNAGPSAIEALFAGELDLTYIGPNPAITGYVRSQGQALKIIAGATSGGSALIVRADSGIQKPENFHGKKVASPQLGNTQDVALRAWLKSHGMTPTEKGGDVRVIPIANADQITLFLRKELDAAWAPEPWASRLVREAGGRLFLDERTLWPEGQFVTTHVMVSTKFLRDHRDLVKKWVRAHVELTDWINKNLPQAKRVLNEEIKKETTKALPDAVLDDSFSRMQITYDPLRSSLLNSAQQAFEAGFLGREKPNLSGIYDLTILNEVLKEKGVSAIR